MDMEDIDIRLRKETWYLGEVGEEAATTILRNCKRDDVFVVHKSPSTNDYIVSVRFPPVEGIQESLIDNFAIRCNNDEKYEITGQSDVYDSIIDAVSSYTISRNLSPALGNNSAQFQQQVSVTSVTEPPQYDQANRQLQPDVAPLPTIDNVNPENPVEATTGRIQGDISPQISSSLSYSDHYHSNYGQPTNRPDYMDNPHWWRYHDKCCCHPKNVWHCCWHRETYWNTYSRAEFDTYRSWYNCRGTGFLRCLLLVLMWSCIWPCVGIGYLIWGLIFLCCIVCGCIDLDDD